MYIFSQNLTASHYLYYCCPDLNLHDLCPGLMQCIFPTCFPSSTLGHSTVCSQYNSWRDQLKHKQVISASLLKAKQNPVFPQNKSQITHKSLYGPLQSVHPVPHLAGPLPIWSQTLSPISHPLLTPLQPLWPFVAPKTCCACSLLEHSSGYSLCLGQFLLKI